MPYDRTHDLTLSVYTTKLPFGINGGITAFFQSGQPYTPLKFEGSDPSEDLKNKYSCFIDSSVHCHLPSWVDWLFHPIFGKGKYKKNSELRKPKPGMFFKAKAEFGIDLENSIMIGDRDTDIMAAQRAHIKNIIYFGDTCKCADTIIIKKLINAKKYLKKY